MQAFELTNEEREQFVEAFPGSEDEDSANPNPWCAPWYWAPLTVFRGSTIEEMAVNFYEDHKTEIELCEDYE